MLTKPITEWDEGQHWGTLAKLVGLYCGAIALTAGANLALPWDSPLRYLRVSATIGALALAASTLRENREFVRGESILAARQGMRTKAAQQLAEQDIERLLNGLESLVSSTPAQPIARGQRLEPPRDRHFALYAPTQSGKTNTLLSLPLDGAIIYCTTKSTDRVPVGWAGYKFSPIASELAPQIKQFCAEMEQKFRDRTNGIGDPYWWILDEAFGITATLKSAGEAKLERQFNSLIISHLATGASAGARMGILTQSPNSGDFAVSKAAMDNLTPIICASHISPAGTAHLAKWYTHTTGQRLTPEQITELNSLPEGFWQLTCQRGQPILYQAGKAEIELVPCREYGTAPAQAQHSTGTAQMLERLYSLPCADSPQERDREVCPSCGSDDIKPNGSYEGRKRGQCRACKKSFYLQG